MQEIINYRELAEEELKEKYNNKIEELKKRKHELQVELKKIDIDFGIKDAMYSETYTGLDQFGISVKNDKITKGMLESSMKKEIDDIDKAIKYCNVYIQTID